MDTHERWIASQSIIDHLISLHKQQKHMLIDIILRYLDDDLIEILKDTKMLMCIADKVGLMSCVRANFSQAELDTSDQMCEQLSMIIDIISEEANLPEGAVRIICEKFICEISLPEDYHKLVEEENEITSTIMTKLYKKYPHRNCYF